jgi:hypothetical protein
MTTTNTTTDERQTIEAPDQFYADPAGRDATSLRWTISRGSEPLGFIIERPTDGAIFAARSLLGQARRKDGRRGCLRGSDGEVLYFDSAAVALEIFREQELELEGAGL